MKTSILLGMLTLLLNEITLAAEQDLEKTRDAAVRQSAMFVAGEIRLAAHPVRGDGHVRHAGHGYGHGLHSKPVSNNKRSFLGDSGSATPGNEGKRLDPMGKDGYVDDGKDDDPSPST